MKVTIYTDGSARGNPGNGGYGAVLIYGNFRKELSEGYRLTTNNRMELMAALKALSALTKDNLEVHIYTDSKYLMDALKKTGFMVGKKKASKMLKILTCGNRSSPFITNM